MGHDTDQPMDFNLFASPDADNSDYPHAPSQTIPVVLCPSMSQADNYFNPWASREGVIVNHFL